MNCHQASWRQVPQQNDPRPNWEPYNTWPGAIGSLDGELRVFEIRDSHRFSNAKDRHLLEKAQFEAKWILDFEDQIKPEHPRYQHLGPFTGPRFPLSLQRSWRFKTRNAWPESSTLSPSYGSGCVHRLR